MTVRRRILVTNDDGVESPGIHRLAAAIAGLGHDVLVVAPLDDRSGTGAALEYVAGRSVHTKELTVDELPGVPFTGIRGTPALAVTMSRMGYFGPPPWCVVSGINPGPNTGRSILHSGTVGAALTGATLGMSGLAVSIDAAHPKHLATAAEMAAETLRWLLTARKRTVLNLNVPDLPLEEVRGVRWGRLAAFGRARMTAVKGPDGHPVLAADSAAIPPDPRTDDGLVAAGYVSVTPITGILAVEDDTAAVHLDRRLSSTERT